MWFKKNEGNKEGLPELPALPELPELPETFKPELPDIDNLSFKNTSRQQIPDLPEKETPILHSLPSQINQEAIKSEIAKEKIRHYTQEINLRPMQAPLGPDFRAMQIKPVEQAKFSPPRIVREADSSPVFVRIDKFQNAVKSFSEIKTQLTEIENYLEDIKRIRAKEDQELGEWERELLDIKAKLESVDRGVFSRLE